MRRTRQLFFYAISYEIRNRDDLQRVLFGERLELGHSGHSAVVIHYLADNGRGLKSSNANEIYTCFRLSRPNQNAPALRT
jgi:hypothetical protein